MKKLLLIVTTVMLFAPYNILAVGISSYEFSLDIESLGEVSDDIYPGEKNITIDVIAETKITTSADFGSFYISYDPKLFDFVSYNGEEGLAFDQVERKIYVPSTIDGNVTFVKGDKIATLVLKPKGDGELYSTNIEYYFYHEIEPLFKNNIDLTFKMPLSLENDVVAPSEKEDNTMLIAYIAGGVTATATVLYFVFKRKNK